MLDVPSHVVAIQPMYDLLLAAWVWALPLHAAVCMYMLIPDCNETSCVLGGRAALVAHFVYHYRLRCCLLTVNTCQQLLGSIEPEVRASMAAVDAIAAKLGIARNSLPRSIWETIKRDIGTYLLTGDTGFNRGSLIASFENLDGLLVTDMITTGCPPNAVHLMPFSQNITTTVLVTSDGEMLIREHAQTYLVSSSKVPSTSFSSDFMSTLQTIRELMQKSITQRLSNDELCRINELSIWQASNFLTHIRPAGLEGGMEHANFTSMASDMGLDLSEIWTAFQAGVSPEEMAMEATTRQLQRQTDFQPQRPVSSQFERNAMHDSDGEEKVDTSEKSGKEKNHRKIQDNVEKVGDVSKPPSQRNEREVLLESTVAGLLTVVVSSDSSLQDVQRACCGLKTQEELQAAASKLENLSQTLESSKSRLENEIFEIHGFIEQQEPGIVVETMRKAIAEKEREMADMSKRLLRTANARDSVRGVLVRSRRLRDLETTEITRHLLRTASTVKLAQKDIRLLVHAISDLIPWHDLLQERASRN